MGLVQFGGGDQAAAGHGTVAPACCGFVQKGNHVGLWWRSLIGRVGGARVVCVGDLGGLGGGASMCRCLLITFAAVASHVIIVAGAKVAAIRCGCCGCTGMDGWCLA